MGAPGVGNDSPDSTAELRVTTGGTVGDDRGPDVAVLDGSHAADSVEVAGQSHATDATDATHAADPVEVAGQEPDTDQDSETDPSLLFSALTWGDPAGPERALLERLAVALNSLRELRAVAALLAEATRDATGADRCTLFVLEGHHLRPIVSRSVEGDRQQRRVIEELGSRELEPADWERFCQGRAKLIPNAADSDVIPREWVETFSLMSVVLIPLVAAGEPVGLLTLDWSSSMSLDREHLRLLETIGSMAAVAVRNVRLIERLGRRAELQTALANAGASLAKPAPPVAISERLADAFTELLHARLCAIALVDDAQATMTTLATRHTRDLRVMPLETIPEELVAAIGPAWADGKQPLELGDDAWLADLLGSREAGVSWYLVLPLVMDGHTRGAALLGFDADTRPDEEERDAAEALAAIAAAALERHDLLHRLGQHIAQLETVYQLTTHASQAADATELMAALNASLAPQGIEVTGLTFRQARLSRYLGGAKPTPEERSAWRTKAGYAHLPDGQLAVPMRLDGRVMGSLRVRPAELDADRRQFLEALAQGVAEVANRGALRAKVEESNRERALEGERARIAADVHDATGQLFIALGLLARRHLQRFPAASEEAAESLRIAELAEHGKARTNEAIREGTFLPAGDRGLVPALCGLAESFERDSGIRVLLDLGSDSERLPPQLERALYRVAHEALTNAWRHAECSVVWLALAPGDDEVVLSVRDNGAGLRSPAADRTHLGVAGMRRSLDEVGGSLVVADVDGGGGVHVTARIPRSGR